MNVKKCPEREGIIVQYHEVKLWVEFARMEDLIVRSNNLRLSDLASSSKLLGDASLLVDYVYIDTEERRRFAQVGHEYLISQLQFTGEEGISSNVLRVKLGFNHPTKELIWAVKSKTFNTAGTHFLGYTHKDDWSDALQYAADNLTESSIEIRETPAVDADAEQDLLATPGVDAWDTEAVVFTNDLTVATGAGDATVFCGYKHVAGSGIDTTGALTPADYAVRWYNAVNSDNVTSVVMPFKKSALYNANNTSYNLGNHVHHFTITWYFTEVDATSGFGTDNSKLRYRVSVDSHSLTVRDLSVPVDAWKTRRYRDCADIVGSLPRNTGLLIDNTYNPVKAGLLQLNGHDRFEKRNGDYFNLVQTLNCHKSTPANGVNVYSFSLHPENHQPSGSCNLSRIDNTTLTLDLVKTVDENALAYYDPARHPPALAHFENGSSCYIYDVNYNVLRIMSGMGGTAYSN